MRFFLMFSPLPNLSVLVGQATIAGTFTALLRAIQQRSVEM